MLIFIDDMGYGDIGPFGNTKVKTPHLDKLAAEGMKFTSFYATPVCSMSRACLMTGCYNARVSIPGVLFPAAKIGLHPDEITLAEVVKQKGYATICIGKWHLGHREPFLPTKQGFDSYFGIPYSNDMTIDPENAVFAKDCVFREGMDEKKAREEAIKHTVPLMRGKEVVEYPADQATLTQRYTAEAVKFIRANQAKPFFVYLPHTMVHVPLAASAAFRGKSASGLLGDAIEELDWSVGQIMQTLKELKLDEKTLVIFTSDNGAASGFVRTVARQEGQQLRRRRARAVHHALAGPHPGRHHVQPDRRQHRPAADVRETRRRRAAAGPRARRPRHHVADVQGRRAAGARHASLFHRRMANSARFARATGSSSSPAPTKKAQPKKGADAKAKTAGSDEVGDGALFDLAKDPYETTDVAAAHPDIVAKLRAEAQRREKEIQEHRRPAGELPADDK